MATDVAFLLDEWWWWPPWRCWLLLDLPDPSWWLCLDEAVTAEADDDDEEATATDVAADADDAAPAKLFWAAAKCDRALVDVDVVKLKSWGDPRHLVSGTPAYLQLLGVGMAPP